jgi:predicted negative regulator of RcsB-dependent stress response
MELAETILREIQHYCSKGDILLEGNDATAAIAAYNKAWELVPDPKNEWEASTWILAAIADASFKGGYLTSARKALD